MTDDEFNERLTKIAETAKARREGAFTTQSDATRALALAETLALLLIEWADARKGSEELLSDLVCFGLRERKVFKSLGLKTVSDLATLRWSAMLSVNGCGMSTAASIEAFAASRGMAIPRD